MRTVAAIGNLVSRWEVQCLINSRLKGKPMTIVTVGIDLAKNVFAVHGAKQRLRQTRLQPPQNIPPPCQS